MNSLREMIQRLRNHQPNHVVMNRIEPIIKAEPLWTHKDESFTVRLAETEDLPVFIRLEEDAYSGFHAWTDRDFESDWKQNPYCVYILVEETASKEVVGMISGRFLAKGSHISHLLVREAFQQRSLGSKLLDLWIRLVKKEAIPQITLEVRESNAVAQKLYFNKQFKHIETHKNYYSDNKESAFLLRKEMDNDASYL
ncbi:ribosomal protein S18-alanine N-acetyltransferase [Aerococcaceae bacterium WGS1372]